MSITNINPANDPAASGPDGNTEALGEILSTDPDVVIPSELRGVNISEAEDQYVGVRSAEKQNTQFSSGTKHNKANKKYAQLLKLDRLARAVFDSPSVGMQTLVIDPKVARDHLSSSVIGPVEQVEIITEGAQRAIKRTRERLNETGNQFIYYGVRDMDTDGLSHWHIYWCLDSTDVDGDSVDLYSGVESHVSNVPGAREADHPATESVKWDPNPERTVEAHGSDISHGGPVHPSARYVASSLPHLGSVGEMESRAVRHGAIEWATSRDVLKSQNRDTLPEEIRRLSAGG